MASTSSFSSLTSTAPISGTKFKSTRRPSKISAAYASVDRPRISISTSTSLYDVLGIKTSATCKEIKQAYRTLARVSHPDVASSGADEFIKIHSAYSTLSDPEKRANYDRTMFVSQAPYGYSAATVYRNRRWETDQCW
ncbi:hypothetical protein QQ045_002022 [Rhodiola kirilowii]